MSMIATAQTYWPLTVAMMVAVTTATPLSLWTKVTIKIRWLRENLAIYCLGAGLTLILRPTVSL